ncbi:MAG TPA: PLP-dependent transferase [Solirubrobacter sp.]|nr:PLP-dependent transferase [Solirubrobacter sp.]
MSDLHPETAVIALGRPPTVPDGPLNVPITPAAPLQAGGPSGYARSGNPPWEALEEVLGALEGGKALTFSSGMAAVAAALRLFGPNPVIVAPEVAYMDVRRVLLELPADVRLVDVTDTDAVLAACEGATVLWLESPTNPLLGVADLPLLCAHARDHKLLCVVDNTFATPLLQRPLELGADVVIHSATKAIGGHSDLLLGAAIVRDDAHLQTLHDARELGGATPGALETYLCLRGLRTLPLRLERAQRNASVLAERLSDHPAVHEVRYPGLASHPQQERAASTLGGPGFMLTFRVHGGAARADALVDAVRVFTHATSLGGVESTLERRARYASEQGVVPEDLLRVSVGCEHVEDLWRDLEHALDATE